MIHHHLTTPIYIPELIISGDRDKDKGVVVRLNDPSEVVKVGAIYVMDVFVPVTILSGTLIADKIYTKNYGGDAIDIFGGRLICNKAFSRKNKPTRPYREYHQDWLQIDGLTNFKKDPRVVLSGTRISHIDVELQGKDAQGISITGKGRTTRAQLGVDKFHMRLDGYPHIINGFQIDHSTLGGTNNKVNGDVYIKNRNDFNSHKTEEVVCTLPVNKYGSL